MPDDLSQERGIEVGRRVFGEGADVPALIELMRVFVLEAELLEPVLEEALAQVPEEQREAEREKVDTYRRAVEETRADLAELLRPPNHFKTQNPN